MSTEFRKSGTYTTPIQFYNSPGGVVIIKLFKIPDVLYEFTTFQFTTLGTTGSVGPSSLAGYGGNYPGIGTSYALALSGGIQYWTVPANGNYSFTVAGAGSFHTTSDNASKIGSGVVMTASRSLVKGDLIAILVGQLGQQNADAGGGSFVVKVPSIGSLSSGTTVYFVAGGAGGPGGESDVGSNSNMDGSLTTSGKDGLYDAPAQAGTGGTAGGGGAVATNPDYSRADSGGGLNGNGAFNGFTGNAANVAKAFVNGGAGSTNNGSGGFGGGGAYGVYGNREGGGGGGYSGGGAGGTNGNGAGGGGGGTYDITGSGTKVATNTGAGYVTITKL